MLTHLVVGNDLAKKKSRKKFVEELKIFVLKQLFCFNNFYFNLNFFVFLFTCSYFIFYLNIYNVLIVVLHAYTFEFLF